MTDHKATVKVEFSIYGETYKADWWINWSVGGEIYELDQRVIDFFRDNYLQARAKYDEANAAAEREQRERRMEADELAELARLQAKYGNR